MLVQQQLTWVPCVRAATTHLGALFITEVERVTNCPLLGSSHTSLNELVVNGVLHERAGAGTAALALEVRGQGYSLLL